MKKEEEEDEGEDGLERLQLQTTAFWEFSINACLVEPDTLGRQTWQRDLTWP